MRHDRIIADIPRVETSAVAADLLAGTFAGLITEELRLIYLDGDCRLLKLSHFPGGARSEMAIPLRLIMREALMLGASALIVAHNHPGGGAGPSRADKVATRRLVEIARPLEIAVLDHLIFADGHWFSFRAAGLL